MKKRLLLVISIIAVMCCFLALTASAEKEITGVTDTYYIVASQDSEAALALQNEGKETIVLSEVYAATNSPTDTDWIAQFEEGSHIELIFAESIVESVNDYAGILLNKAITLTVRYNGFCHLVTNARRENVFVLKHSGAQLNLIGSTDIYDENGNVLKDFTYNSSDLTKNMVQVRHGKVYCWVFDGDVYAENVRTSTGEEFVYTIDDNNTSADPSVINTYEFVDCAISSSATGICADGKDSAQKIVITRGGYYNHIKANTICNGTLFENCEIGIFEMDCWAITKQLAEFVNCTIGKISTKSGRTHLKLIDCTIEESNISVGDDGGGDGFVMIFTTADCENAGTYNLKRTTSRGTAFPWQEMVDAFLAENSVALGHLDTLSFTFADAKYLSTCTATTACSRCERASSETIEAMFIALGFSYFEDTQKPSICIGFDINRDAIARYEELSGCTVSFGAAVAAESRLGTSNAPLDENGNAVELEAGKVLAVDVKEYNPASFNIKIILNESHLDTSVLLTGYIKVQNGDALEISYMQNTQALVADNVFTYVSYNSLVSADTAE